MNKRYFDASLHTFIKIKRSFNKSLRCNIFLMFSFVRLMQNLIKVIQSLNKAKPDFIKIKQDKDNQKVATFRKKGGKILHKRWQHS